MPTFWEQVPGGPGGAPMLPSRVLMRALQASCWSEEFSDPAASQVRHERPAGFIGVWPELAFVRHSCAPNSSCVVVDRYLLLHATEDMEAGDEVTFNKIGGAIAAPLAERQAAHLELFGRPCACRRCKLEAELPPDAQRRLRAVYDDAQGAWPERLRELLERAAAAAEDGSDADAQEAAADALADLQQEVDEAVGALDGALAPSIPSREDRLLVAAAAYPGFDLAWQMEELLSGGGGGEDEEAGDAATTTAQPELEKLANCVALLRQFARGSESHMYTALLLDQAYTQRAEALRLEAAALTRRASARARRLTARINKLVAGARLAAYAYTEAAACRYGMLPPEDTGGGGLLRQLEEGLVLFYAGLNALSSGADGGGEGGGGDGGSGPALTRSLTVGGIPVTVVDTVDGAGVAPAAVQFIEAEAAEAGGGDDDEEEELDLDLEGGEEEALEPWGLVDAETQAALAALEGGGDGGAPQKKQKQQRSPPSRGGSGSKRAVG